MQSVAYFELPKWRTWSRKITRSEAAIATMAVCMALFASSNEPSPLDVELDRHDPLVVHAPDPLGAVDELDLRELRERDQRAVRRRDEEVVERGDRAPVRGVEPGDDGIDLVALVERRAGAARDRGV